MPCPRSLRNILALALLSVPSSAFLSLPKAQRTTIPLSVASSDKDLAAKEALQRTAAHLERLKEQQPRTKPPSDDPLDQERQELYQAYLRQLANALKIELKQRGLARTGRKPDLAARLAEYDLQAEYGIQIDQEDQMESPWMDVNDALPIRNFAGMQLSDAAANALGAANFQTPSLIQDEAIPALARGESAILHAETGSGKTLAYLLPFTERLWQDAENIGFGLILTPTRELAAQVAGIATALSPPGTVRLISHPMNLLTDGIKERGELEYGGRIDDDRSSYQPRLYIGSAKSIMHSLYGDGVMPASPTSKPEAMFFLRNVCYLVLDEVDRCLGVKKTRASKQRGGKIHERPAAIVTAAVTRMTLGRAQMVAASATVGRPLKRELARVMGLPPQNCPPVLRGSSRPKRQQHGTSTRAVTIPSTVRNYVFAIDGSSPGKLLTSAFFVLRELSTTPKRILLVLTRGCGISTQNAIGALKHFQCQPEPLSLLDALEASGGTNEMIEIHRQVSGATGIGEASSSREEGYLLVTGEDTVRGLHLDGLDLVVVVGRPHGPDEYTHIAGRTGRAGRQGSVVNVVSIDNAAALKSWERMLDLQFEPLEAKDIKSL